MRRPTRSDILSALFLAPLVVMMLCQAFPWAGRALATAINGIVVPNKVTTGDTASQFPVADSNEIQGGFYQLQYSSELRNIPEARRRRGMFAYAADSGKIYQLYSTPGHWWRHYNPQTDITGKLDAAVFAQYTSTALQAALARYAALQAWAQAELDKKTDKEVFDKHTSAQYQAAQGPPGEDGYTPVHGTDYFDGRDGHSYSCNITGGVRGVSYDSDGKNPQPATLGTFMANMYRDAEELVATSWEWFNAVVGTHLTSPPQEQDGSQYKHQYFQPGIQGSYSANRSNNYISVMVGYSSSSVPFGKFYCTAAIPITVTKAGPQGIQGLQGPPGQSTEQSVIDLFANTASDNALQHRVASPDRNTPKQTFRDMTGNVRHWVSAWGDHYFKMGSIVTMEIQTNGVVLIRDAITGFIRTRIEKNTWTMYADDGSTVRFKVYSDGKYHGAEGYPTNVSKTCPYVRTDGFRGYTTCGSTGGGGGLGNPQTIPAAGQFFQSPSGKTRLALYTSGRLVIY